MNIVYKKIPVTDQEKLRKLIDSVLESLERPEFFIPYEEWEYEKMFDESYAPLYGAYDGNELVAMAQLYIDQPMLQEYIELLGLNNYKVCELGGALCLKEYRKQGIMTHLMHNLMNYAKEKNYDYIVTMAHPDNVASNHMIESLGLNLVKEAVVNGGFNRKIYSLNITQ